MFISLDWISDFVDLSDIDSKVIADRLTMATAEVEGITTLQRFVEGVIVGEIITAIPLEAPPGKKLTSCIVRCGEREYSTVCGAPNARVGLKAPFAPAGTVLGDKKIEKSSLAGHSSEGILCSASELGMSDWHDIVFECPASIPSGTPWSELVPATDTLIEIDNKSLTHRPDLWGHYGIARELAAIFRRPLAPLPRHNIDQYASLPAVSIEIIDENCPCYSAMTLATKGGVNDLPSPLSMQRRLHALGRRTYNLLVDVTNYVSLEIGQPTHAFDAELVRHIKVAPLEKNALFTTLDGVERKLLPDDMLICDGDKPIALAGIMGGLETEVTEKTTRILLESANFKASRIRKTAGRLDLRTDASQRYEKSQPPCNVKVAVERILYLIAESGLQYQVESCFSLAGNLADETRTILLPPGRLNRLAGIDFSQETVIEILQSIGFGPKFLADGTLQVEIPPFRSVKDIAIPEDIVEEMMRLYGFDNIPPVMPALELKPLFVEKQIKMEHKARRLLASAYGFLEVHHYGWMNDNWLTKLGFDPGPTLVLQNPAVLGESRLRTTLLPNLFTLVPQNRPFFDRFRAFELGHVYLPKGAIDDQSPCRDSGEKCGEQPRLAGVSFVQSGQSPEEHYLQIKGALEDLGRIFNQNEPPLTFVAVTDTSSSQGSCRISSPWEREGNAVDIYQGHVRIGTLGMVDKDLLSIISPEGGQIVWFEIELDKFSGNLYPQIAFVEPPRFPGSWQDFSLVWNIADGYEKLEKKLNEFSDPLVLKREFVTIYSGKGMEKGTASYSFRYEIGASDHTLSGEEIDAFHQKFLNFLTTAEIRIR